MYASSDCNCKCMKPLTFKQTIRVNEVANINNEAAEGCAGAVYERCLWFDAPARFLND